MACSWKYHHRTRSYGGGGLPDVLKGLFRNDFGSKRAWVPLKRRCYSLLPEWIIFMVVAAPRTVACIGTQSITGKTLAVPAMGRESSNNVE
jgi:hypothetical protein